MNHSPTPWKTDLAYDEDADGIPIYCDYEHEGRTYTAHAAVVPAFKNAVSDEQKINAALIVRAVNNHEALLDALRQSAAALATISTNATDATKQFALEHFTKARAAIVAAETQTEGEKP